MMRHVGALVALVAIGIAPATAGKAGAVRHAYYLFLADAPQGCEDCYIPLVVVPHTLEEVAASGRDATVGERGVSLAAAEVVARERIVRLRGRRYRYQKVAPADVLRVLAVPDKASLEDLTAAFRASDRSTP